MTAGFARVSLEAIADPRLSVVDLGVYAGLASCLGFGTARGWAGYRRIADRSHVAGSTARRSLEHLEACGHIRREVGKGKRTRWSLVAFADEAEPSLRLVGTALAASAPAADTAPRASAHVAESERTLRSERAHDQRFSQSQDPEGPAARDQDPEPDPLEVFAHGIGRRLDPHAWGTPIGEVLDEIIEGDDP